MPLRILITGTTGESMPPPYAGIPKLSLLYSRLWKKMGHKVAIVFVYRPVKADDLGAGAEYFFEYNSKPNKLRKSLFLLKYFFANPLLYFNLLKGYLKIFPRFSTEVILYPAYGVFMDRIFSFFKPDIVLSEAALIKTFMVAQIAKRRKVPVVFDTYGEVRDLSVGVNPLLHEKKRTKYWKSFFDLAASPTRATGRRPSCLMLRRRTPECRCWCWFAIGGGVVVVLAAGRYLADAGQVPSRSAG